jgi:hypothetical protein
LPQYWDTEESDVFILAGAEDLVPVLVESSGQWQRETLSPRTVDGKTYRIQRYQSRIERWTNETDPQDSFWRSISKDNITTWYDKTEESRIVNPADPIRIFSWLICESYNDKGNVIVYRYREENADKADLFQVHERNRGEKTDKLRMANRYLKRIRYGNHKPYRQSWKPTLLGLLCPKTISGSSKLFSTMASTIPRRRPRTKTISGLPATIRSPPIGPASRCEPTACANGS